jgi:hypothetical protein
MGWPASIGVGILTGIASLFLAGYLANLAVGWYSVSSFEGGSGYFVLGLALLAGFAGILIGVITARVIAGGADPGFLKAIAYSLLIALGSIGVIGGVSRFLADVPPRLNGEEMLLAVEFRWPAGSPLPPASDTVEWSVRLGALSGKTMRVSNEGPLWREDARREGEHWIVPGAVGLFTSRGDRLISALPDSLLPMSFLVPLPGRPGAEFLEWSEWLPRAKDGAAALPDGVRYRFRVVPVSQPIREQTIGAFVIATIAREFSSLRYSNQPAQWNADAIFRVRHAGEPVTVAAADSGRAIEQFEGVAVIEGTTPSLVLRVAEASRESSCHLATVDAGSVRTVRIGRCGAPFHSGPLTDDAKRVAEHTTVRQADGRVDRASFGGARYFLFPDAVLDVTSLAVRPFDPAGQARLIERLPPLGIAPDGGSFVRLAWSEASTAEYELEVTRLDGGARYRLPIDRARMRFGTMDQIDPAWLRHHFEWRRGADGVDELVARTAFDPFPFRGTLTEDGSGYREYRVQPASPALREAMIEFLVREFGGERLPVATDAFAHEVRIGEAVVNVSYTEGTGSDAHVGVWMDRGTDLGLVATIAARFDAALATRRYDALMAP